MEEYKVILKKDKLSGIALLFVDFSDYRTFHFLGICRVKRCSLKEPGKSEKITSSIGERR